MRQAGSQEQGGRGQQRQRSGYTYINEGELTRDKEIARVIAVRENTEPLKEGQRRFSDVIVKIAFRGETRLLGFKLDNPNLIILQREFSIDETKWVDKEFFLFSETEEFTGKKYVRAEPMPEKGKKSKS